MVITSCGDGNCLFRSLSFQLLGSEEEHPAICTIAIRSKSSITVAYLTELNKATMAEHYYVQHIQRSDVFGTHAEILAIVTLLLAGSPLVYSTDEYGQETFSLVWSRGLQRIVLPGMSRFRRGLRTFLVY